MGVDNLTVFDVFSLGFCGLMPDEFMQTVNTDARLAGVLVLVVIADMKK